MIPSECVRLVALLNARCPSMRLDEATPDAWYIDLQHVSFEDGYRAVVDCSREQPYVALCELLDRVESYRADRERDVRKAEQERDAERLQAAYDAQWRAEWAALPEARRAEVEAHAAALKRRREREPDKPLPEIGRVPLPDWASPDSLAQNRAEALAALEAMPTEGANDAG